MNVTRFQNAINEAQVNQSTVVRSQGAYSRYPLLPIDVFLTLGNDPQKSNVLIRAMTIESNTLVRTKEQKDEREIQFKKEREIGERSALQSSKKRANQ